jgi:predicted nucleic acid-binding protein
MGERRRGRMQSWLSQFQVLAYDDATAHIWAQIRCAREQAGHPISAQDAWAAAYALRHEAVLLAHYAGDYDGIDGLDVVSGASTEL